jgi:hypothetical protein
MVELKKYLNPLFFVIVIICFFLPFFNLMCEQQKIASITGFELITGTTITTNNLNKSITRIPNSTDEMSKVKSDTVTPEPLALIAFLTAIIGLVISFFKKFSDIGSAVAGLLGGLCLIFLSNVISDNILGKIQYVPLSVELALGYYIAMILFAILLIFNMYLFFQRISYQPSDQGTFESRMRSCPRCGSMNDVVSIYCNICGSKMKDDMF